MSLRFFVLGPVQVRSDAGLVSPGGSVTRTLLADLLLHVGRIVSYDRLLYDIWGDDSRPALHRLHALVGRLRHAIGPDLIEQVDHSYVLRAHPAEIDAHRFETLIERAALAEVPEEARALCLEAFDLWRGVPYGDLADRDFLRLEVTRLDEVRVNGLEVCVEADLALGRHRQIVGSLRNAVTEFPFNERLWLGYLTALLRSGRRPEALKAYRELEGLLDRELAMEPGEGLQALREEIATG